MNDLRNHIDKNRNLFDDREPVEGHFERFEERLNRHAQENERKRRLKVRFWGTISVAASIVFVITGIWAYKSSNDNDSAKENFSEFTETEAFYKGQMDEQIAGIYCKLAKADDETRAILEKDLEDIIEDAANFAEEIRDVENEELATFYLVEHYAANLDALQFINDKLGEYYKC
jgi:hypothetical protein